MARMILNNKYKIITKTDSVFTDFNLIANSLDMFIEENFHVLIILRKRVA